LTEPCDLTAVEARTLIGQKTLSPVELLESCIARIEAVDHAVNAMVARDFDRARAQAKAAEAAVARGEQLPLLHGLPMGVKDLEETEGLRTTSGSPIFRDHVPAQDDIHVAQLRKAGAIVVGKTNVPEFGAGANSRNTVYGTTGNPFDTTKNAAGSSGGSAVALATNMVPIATGSDTGGSLRNPASFNGVVGFRCSQGLVPSARRPIGFSTNGVLGPMGRNVADTALMMAAMASDDSRDPMATAVFGKKVHEPTDFWPVKPIDLSALRAAFSVDLGFSPVERIVADAFTDKTARFRGVFGRSEDADPDMNGADRAFEVGRAVGFLGRFRKWYAERPQDLGPNIRANVEEGMRYSLADWAEAHIEQTRIYRAFQDFFTRFDVLITPAITTSPRSWRELYPAEIDGKPTRTYFHWLALAYGVTLTGHPAIAIPCGLDRLGMPFGLQVVGPRGGDAFVLRVAAALERRFAEDQALARPVPDIAKLKAAPPIAEMPEFKGWG